MKSRNLLPSQMIGAVWTVAYALLTGFGPTAFQNSDVESVLSVFVLPIACLLAVFLYFRTGGYIAFGTLALATLTLSIPTGLSTHIPDLTTLFSMLALLAGGPLALARSIWLAYRTKRGSHGEHETAGVQN